MSFLVIIVINVSFEVILPRCRTLSAVLEGFSIFCCEFYVILQIASSRARHFGNTYCNRH